LQAPGPYTTCMTMSLNCPSRILREKTSGRWLDSCHVSRGGLKAALTTVLFFHLLVTRIF
jgi:hypothetical protein